MNKRDFIKDALLGVAVGDALGVPVEFLPRKALINEPVTDMRGNGSHRQPKGTWSDDSSLTFCLAEMLCSGYDLKDLTKRFINWKQNAYWTAHDYVFDIGIATSVAIDKLGQGVNPLLAGGSEEYDNGNGSLMRILPLVFYVKDKPVGERFDIVRDVSSLTHRHIRAVIGCFIYIEMAIHILNGKDKWGAYNLAVKNVNEFLTENPICSQSEINKYHRILCNPSSNESIKPIYELDEQEIHSSGYVVSTLEASLWCLLRTDSYKDAVLKAVNLGSDTDTTGAVTGGLAGLLYGCQTIPEDWTTTLVRRNDIEDLAQRLSQKLK